MPDENVTQLSPMRSSYVVCTCDNDKTDNILNEAVCSKEKSITCDVIRSKPYQRNTCYAKRKRRALQSRLSFIPNNFVQHHNRLKASNSILRHLSYSLRWPIANRFVCRRPYSSFVVRCVLTIKLLQLTIDLNFFLKNTWPCLFKIWFDAFLVQEEYACKFHNPCPAGSIGVGGQNGLNLTI